jgi:cysteine protease ATG4
MLIGFLIRDEHDWHQWRKAVSGAEGKPIVHVSDSELALHGTRVERSSALDEVEAFDDEC